MTVEVGIGRSTTFTSWEWNNDPELVVKQAINRHWGENKRDGELTAALMMLQSGGNGGSINTKNPYWAIGEYPDEKAALAADYKVGDATINLGTAHDRFFTGDRLFVTDGTNTAEVRLGSKVTAGVYNVTQSLSNTTTPTLASATAIVDVLAPAVTYDDAARNYLNVKGDKVGNYMQRMRDTVGSGKWERGEITLADNSLEGLIRKGLRSMHRKLNKTFYTNSYAATSYSGSTEDYGIMGTIPHFLNPRNLTSVTEDPAAGTRNLAHAEYKGVNRVDTGTAISIDNIDEWSCDLFERGSEMKAFFCSPLMYKELRKAFHGNVNIYRETFGALNPGLPNAFSHQVLDLSFGRLMLVPDRGATGIRQILTDGTNTSDQLRWGVALDMSDVGIQYYIPDGEGAQQIHIRDIDKIRNTSIDEVEFDGTMTFAMGDPRLHGYYGITNT